MSKPINYLAFVGFNTTVEQLLKIKALQKDRGGSLSEVMRYLVNRALDKIEQVRRIERGDV